MYENVALNQILQNMPCRIIIPIDDFQDNALSWIFIHDKTLRLVYHKKVGSSVRHIPEIIQRMDFDKLRFQAFTASLRIAQNEYRGRQLWDLATNWPTFEVKEWDDGEAGDILLWCVNGTENGFAPIILKSKNIDRLLDTERQINTLFLNGIINVTPNCANQCGSPFHLTPCISQYSLLDYLSLSLS